MYNVNLILASCLAPGVVTLRTLCNQKETTHLQCSTCSGL